MKRIKKLLSAVLTLSIVFAIAASVPLEAAACGSYLTHPNHAQLTGGVGQYGSYRRYFWVHSAASGYASQIEQARSEWVNTSGILTTSIDWGKTTTQSSAVVDIHDRQAFPHESGVVAETRYYSASHIMTRTPTANYKWCEIILNTSNFSALSYANKVGTISHEFGHCMGLAHSTGATRIMTTFANGRTATRANYTDLATINHIYG